MSALNEPLFAEVHVSIILILERHGTYSVLLEKMLAKVTSSTIDSLVVPQLFRSNMIEKLILSIHSQGKILTASNRQAKYQTL